MSNKLELAVFNKVRARFMTRVGAPEISPLALKLAHVIAFKRMNHSTQVLFIAQDELAREVGATERSVRRLLPVLQSCGLSIEQGNGRGNASTYWFATEVERGTPESSFKEERETPESSFKPAKGGHLRHVKEDTRVRPILKKNSKGEVATQLHPGERERGTAAPSHGAADAAHGKQAGAGKQGAAPHNAADRFDELRTVWVRPWPDNDAASRQAFNEACCSTDPDVIIAAARRWVKAADAPRFLPSLAKWLAARSWEKLPPKKHQGKAAGRRGRGKPDLTKEFLKQGGWVEDEDGSVTDPETGRTLQ